jgi:hypothetical protein
MAGLPRIIGVGLACLSSGCEPELVVGTWACPAPVAPPTGDAGVATSLAKVVDLPWTTGFETTGFCDFARAGGFCYSKPDASYTIVDAPAHDGRSAAAFSVTTDPARSGSQARCFREGALPGEAVYGAWFYVPSLAENAGNWNLMHFQGGAPNALHGLWDVSLDNADDGNLFLYLFDFLGAGIRRAPAGAVPPVPIASWFHVELRLRRAADATGEVALYQDGLLVLELTSLRTDDTDFGQWYVGNLASGLNPLDSTVYIDDVTISAAPP